MNGWRRHHRHLPIDARKLTRADRVIAWCLGFRFPTNGRR